MPPFPTKIQKKAATFLVFFERKLFSRQHVHVINEKSKALGQDPGIWTNQDFMIRETCFFLFILRLFVGIPLIMIATGIVKSKHWTIHCSESGD